MYIEKRRPDEGLDSFVRRTLGLAGTRAGVCVCTHVYTGSTASFSSTLYKCVECGKGLACGSKGTNCLCYRGETAEGKFLSPMGRVVTRP